MISIKSVKNNDGSFIEVVRKDEKTSISTVNIHPAGTVLKCIIAPGISVIVPIEDNNND